MVMASALTLDVVTPERLVLQAQADEVIVPAYDGFRGILPGHEALVTPLKFGELTYRSGGQTHSLVVGAGLVEVRNDLVNVLVESARKPDEIDASAAETTKRAAQEKLHRVDDKIDYQAVQAEVERADVLLEVSKKPG
jgi:F-type H+-transporting ATPase subunit epsilon